MEVEWRSRQEARRKTELSSRAAAVDLVVRITVGSHDFVITTQQEIYLHDDTRTKIIAPFIL